VHVSAIKLVYQVLEDSKSVLAFTTERIVCSLADIMTRFSSVSGGASSVASYLEGYLEVCTALTWKTIYRDGIGVYSQMAL
jgi:hypothetical protein